MGNNEPSTVNEKRSNLFCQGLLIEKVGICVVDDYRIESFVGFKAVCVTTLELKRRLADVLSLRYFDHTRRKIKCKSALDAELQIHRGHNSRTASQIENFRFRSDGGNRSDSSSDRTWLVKIGPSRFLVGSTEGRLGKT